MRLLNWLLKVETVAQKGSGSSQTRTTGVESHCTSHSTENKKRARGRTNLQSSVLNDRIGLLHVCIPKAVKISFVDTNKLLQFG